MKSAYAILRVPITASDEAIRQAYELAAKHYPKEILIENPSLSESLREVNEAYKILSTKELRQWHDRMLSAAISPPRRQMAYPAVDPEPSKWAALRIMLIALIALFAIGTYYAQVREESRKARFAHELALKKKAEEDARNAAQEQAAAEAAQATANALAESSERELRAESAPTVRQASASQTIAPQVLER